MLQFFKTTIFGGVVFLVPVVIIVFIIGKALVFTRKLSAPFAQALPFGPVGDAIAVNVIGLALIVLGCFLGGLAAKSTAATNLVETLENKFLNKIPIYALIKNTVSNTVKKDDAEGMKPVLVSFDDSWQIAFEVERLAGGKITLFLPGAPDPWSGSVCFVTEDRVKSLDANFLSVAKILKSYGRGAGGNIQA